jgi:peptidoglycan/LPS O-acetylase OafA/YrhL
MALAFGAGAAALMRWLARWSPGWAVASGAAVALLIWSSSWQPDLPQPYRNITTIILALALGAFFFIATRRQGRRMRSAIIAGLIAFAVAGALTYPVKNHAVKLDMPRPR